MNDALLAKDLLLGKKSVQMSRIENSRTVKFFMRPTGRLRKDKKYLIALGEYCAASTPSFHKTNLKFTVLDAPGEYNDFFILEVISENKNDADVVVSRWNQYKEIAFGGE